MSTDIVVGISISLNVSKGAFNSRWSHTACMYVNIIAELLEFWRGSVIFGTENIL